MFAAATATPGYSVECRINHEVHTFASIGSEYFVNAGNWLSAFWLAIVCRDQGKLDSLSDVPIELLRASGQEYDEYVYNWIDTLQSYWADRPGLIEKLTATLQNSDPAVATIAPRELLDHILYPPINLFYRSIRRGQADYNDALVEAINLHKEYWTADDDRRVLLGGNLALGPLAITCLAYDAGITISVESEYIPKGLLRRGRPGEFPT